MDRAYKVFDLETSYEDIISTLNFFGITEYYDALDTSMFSRNLKDHQAIIFKEIKVTLVNADVFNKQMDKWLNAFPDVKLTKFASIKENEIKGDEPVHSFLPSKDNWGLHRTNVFNTSLTGEGVNVAILDTGFDEGHPDYPSERNIYKNSFISNSAQDDHGHGMHCTGIACGYIHENLRYGIACKSNIYSCKVLNSQQKGFQADVIRGIFWAVHHKCKVINISYGVKNNGKLYDVVFERAIKFAFDKSCIVVAAVGNDSDRSIAGKTPMALRSPSDCPSAISVSAIDRNNKIYRHSNRASRGYNQTIHFTAPGVDIYSSWSRSSVSGLNNKVISGTSMAAPFVTGMIALLWQKFPNSHPQHIINRMKTSAFKSMQWDYEDVGYGLIQAPYLGISVTKNKTNKQIMEQTTQSTFIGNIDLSNESDFQAIYSSQLYGTFFMIYGRFKSKPDTKYQLENIELKLLNYKGLINLGLTRARFVEIKDADKTLIGGKIILEVQACNDNTYLKSVDNIEGNSFGINHFINVDRRVKKMDSTNDSSVFDEEFLYREGFKRNVATPNDLATVETETHNRGLIPGGDYSSDEALGEALGGFLCPRSENKVIR